MAKMKAVFGIQVPASLTSLNPITFVGIQAVSSPDAKPDKIDFEMVPDSVKFPVRANQPACSGTAVDKQTGHSYPVDVALNPDGPATDSSVPVLISITNDLAPPLPPLTLSITLTYK